jgi:ABC-type multidrug transport system fused ATPase/permease subunit
MERNRAALPYDEETIEEFFESIPVQKVGIFHNVRRFFKRLFGVKKTEPVEVEGVEAYSKFKHYYYELDKTDPDYLTIRHAATLCDDALRVATQRLKTSKRLNVLTMQIDELDAFIKLTDEEVEDLKRMLERFVALASERGVLLEKLTDYDSSLVSMEPLADDAWQAMPSIKDAEKHQRALRMDIGYLTGEKEELIFEREDMLKNSQFIRKFTVITLAVFATVVAGVLALTLTEINFNLPLVVFILVILAMSFVSIINVFGFRLRREIKTNAKKQQRAIELLNKKSVVYAYYTNFLRYCYKKYKAANSRTLENNLNDLESYRHLANRIDTVRNLMYETETSIERFVREKKLGGVKSTVEGFAKTINLEDKRRRFTELRAEKEVSEKTLLELDKRHEEIWDALTRISSDDATNTVNGIIESYMNEAQKLFVAHNEEESQEPRPIWKLFELFAEGEEGLSPVAAEIVTDIKTEGALPPPPPQGD